MEHAGWVWAVSGVRGGEAAKAAVNLIEQEMPVCQASSRAASAFSVPFGAYQRELGDTGRRNRAGDTDPVTTCEIAN